MDEEWTDEEIRGLIERIAMERRRAERRARTKRTEPRPLVARRRPSPKAVPAEAGVTAKKRRLAG